MNKRDIYELKFLTIHYALCLAVHSLKEIAVIINIVCKAIFLLLEANWYEANNMYRKTQHSSDKSFAKL